MHVARSSLICLLVPRVRHTHTHCTLRCTYLRQNLPACIAFASRRRTGTLLQVRARLHGTVHTRKHTPSAQAICGCRCLWTELNGLVVALARAWVSPWMGGRPSGQSESSNGDTGEGSFQCTLDRMGPWRCRRMQSEPVCAGCCCCATLLLPGRGQTAASLPAAAWSSPLRRPPSELA
jgi:hypothetical protein